MMNFKISLLKLILFTENPKSSFGINQTFLFALENLRKLRIIANAYVDENGLSRNLVENSEFPEIFFKLFFGESVSRFTMMECFTNETLYDFVQNYEFQADFIDELMFTKMWQKQAGICNIIFDELACDGKISLSCFIRFLPSVFGPRY